MFLYCFPNDPTLSRHRRRRYQRRVERQERALSAATAAATAAAESPYIPSVELPTLSVVLTYAAPHGAANQPVVCEAA